MFDVIETRPAGHGAPRVVRDTVFPARFIGRCGPDGTGEFYSGVRPGDYGEARLTEWYNPETGEGSDLVSLSFHRYGGAWLSVFREEVVGL